VTRFTVRKGRAPADAEIAFELGMELPEYRVFAAEAER